MSSAALLTKCGQCLFSCIGAMDVQSFSVSCGEPRMAEAGGFMHGSEGKLLKTVN